MLALFFCYAFFATLAEGGKKPSAIKTKASFLAAQRSCIFRLRLNKQRTDRSNPSPCCAGDEASKPKV
jgi:hypothetical protein